MTNLKPDYDHVISLIKPGRHVLDLGCGNGELLERLIKEKNATGLGVEIDEHNVLECIGRGLSIFQGNIDEGLNNYPDNSYDYVILNQTLQVVHKPDYVLSEMLRVGNQIIVSFPNFAYWQIRLNLLFSGSMPKTKFLPFEWYNTPNIHLLSIKDFKNMCVRQKWTILEEIYIGSKTDIFSLGKLISPNLFAEEAIFLLTNKGRV
ncbi:MAG: methionine biosynthesis protein MetW [bacterium]